MVNSRDAFNEMVKDEPGEYADPEDKALELYEEGRIVRGDIEY